MDKYNYEYSILKYRLLLNKRLYEEKVIDIETYQKMEDYLIKKLNRGWYLLIL